MLEAVRPDAITVISGEAGRIGEPAARTVLSLQLALLWAALRSRTERSRIFLGLDEAAWFANETLGQMFRLGRRWNLSVLLATQSLELFREDLREALWTNASDFVVFRGSSEEARQFERWNPEASPERLARLARGEAAVFLEKGRAPGWIRLRPRTEPLLTDRLRQAAERSRPLWSPDPETVGGPTDAPPAPPRQRGVAPKAAEAALRVLQSDPSATTITIPLSRLRVEHRGPESSWRELGRWLSSQGRLRSERGSEGTVWSVDVAGLELEDPPGPAPVSGGTGAVGSEGSGGPSP
jgi:hypothetical protein